MAAVAPPASRRGWRWQRVLAVLGAVLLALALLVAFFPWDLLRGPLGRYVSERTGRRFEITHRLDVHLGRPTRIVAEGVRFANPAWARDRELLEAERVEVAVRLLPLLKRRLELPEVALVRPRLGLELLPDGRRTWSLDREGGGDAMAVEVGTLRVDRGDVHFLAPGYGADIRAAIGLEEGAGQALPLRLQAQGRWRGQPFAAQGRTGGVLALARREGGAPFPLALEATAGDTALRLEGQVADLAGFDGADLALRLRGPDLARLDPLLPVVLPGTGPYAVAMRLRRDGARWTMDDIAATLGRSDVAGALVLDRSRPVPRLEGRLQARRLDFEDLGPLVGVKPAPARKTGDGRPAARDPGRKVLPRQPLDLARLRRMDADVRFSAAQVVNAPGLPLERITARVRLDGGALRLEPLEFGLAGGRLAGTLAIAGDKSPPQGRLDLRAEGLQLGRLLPDVPRNRASSGTLQGHVDLAGRGPSLGALLAGASGEVSLLMGPGHISNLLLEFAGLDGGEIIKFLAGRDQQVRLRCAAIGFAVQDGLMTGRPLVLDTVDTVVWGQGTINLPNETLDLTFHPRPKDMSILSLRSPLRLTGTLGAPQAGVDKGALAARAGAAVVLGAINPLLGLAATLETGPGKDVDCAAVLRQAAAPQAATSGGPPAAAPGRREAGAASGRP